MDLKKILEMSEKQVVQHIVRTVKPMVSDGENWFLYKGHGPICLVAHIDSHAPVKEKKVNRYNNKLWSPSNVLGADDRNGVYAMLSIFKSMGKKCPTLLFTNYEESGGRGATKFVADNEMDLGQFNIVIELDRKNNHEYVFYNQTPTKGLKKYLESYGFVESAGSFTDISIFDSIYNVACVNLSIGYYNQHTSKEYALMDEVELTTNRVIRMIKNPPPKTKVTVKEYQWRTWEKNGDAYSLKDGKKKSYKYTGKYWEDEWDAYNKERRALEISKINDLGDYDGRKDLLWNL